MRLGADPEVFICATKGKRLFSSCGKIGGTKSEPLQIPGLPVGFTIQEDNVAVEFGIPPCSTAGQFSEAIRLVQLRGIDYVREKMHQTAGVSFSGLSCTVFPKKELVHPGALIFGCEPDYNAWTGTMNPAIILENDAMRSAGGHIHVETTLDKTTLVKALDVTIGCATLLLESDGALRRALYGKAGAFRPKPYGIEYRVPSNFWIFESYLVQSMWNRVHHAMTLIEEGVNFSYLGNRIQHAINTNNTIEAGKILEKFGCSVGAFE